MHAVKGQISTIPATSALSLMEPSLNPAASSPSVREEPRHKLNPNLETSEWAAFFGIYSHREQDIV